MEKKNLLGLDLQLFGDEEVAGANEVEESATPQEEETTETETAETIESKDGNDEPEQTAEDKPAQSAEMNAQFAAMRRKAESEANQRVEEINRAFAALCQGRVNPDTGKPITTALEYAEALRNQERREIEQNLRDNNVDPDVIKRSIALSPEMQQVRQIIEEAQNAKAMSDIQQDLEEIRKIDPSINSLQDIPEDMANQMIAYVKDKGLRFSEAYKIVNFGNIAQNNKSAGRQEAINQMRGKAHLASQPTGVATEGDEVDVPASIMASQKADGKSEKQIRESYRQIVKKLGLN